MADESSSDDAPKVPFTLALIAGGCAGTAVDVALYPLDTLRTRMQAPEGFMKAGGFSGVYNGVMATALGAAPGAALFFSAYEGMKPKLQALNGGKEHPLQHSFAASCGEVAACLIRVPTAVVTQRMQVGQYQNYPQAMKARRLCRRAAQRTAAAAGTPPALGRSSLAQATAWAIHAEAGLMTFYTGYWTTVAREIPFSFIQFPIYEGLKKGWKNFQGSDTTPMQGAVCGSISGAISSAVTTPLDVVKTRMMLGSKTAAGDAYVGTVNSLQTIAREEGAMALFKGIGPRVGWITIGGYIFFGAYEKSMEMLWDSGVWGKKPKFSKSS